MSIKIRVSPPDYVKFIKKTNIKFHLGYFGIKAFILLADTFMIIFLHKVLIA